MTLAIVSGTAPDYWASFLINGDGSSLDGEEQAKASKFRDWLVSGDSRGSIVSCSEEPFFVHQHDAAQFGVLPAMCVTYDALINAESVE